MHKLICLIFILTPAYAFAQEHPSPYAGEQSRAIKALSDGEVRGYLTGQGMALAKAGELNHYPGPLHVLELTRPLGLSEAQKLQTEKIRDSMLSETINIGERLVEKERELDASFAGGTIDEAKLKDSVAEIGRLQGELRAAHLRAHLEQKRVLTPEQVAKYDRLRGYDRPETPMRHEGRH